MELFENEIDLAVYESFEDALAKVDFYLRHETLRQEIINNGRRKVLEEHSLQRRLEKILEVSGITRM